VKRLSADRALNIGSRCPCLYHRVAGKLSKFDVKQGLYGGGRSLAEPPFSIYLRSKSERKLAMKNQRIPVIQQIAAGMRDERPVDVYQVVKDIQSEFPEVAQETLVRIVSEEVVKSGCNAIWDRRK
jgi:hypothetical protein